MSKGKRKSDPGALLLVRQRLQAARCQGQWASIFTEADRELLSLICRVDLIQILEVDLQLGTLKASQKNSVSCMIDFLLSKQAQGQAARGGKEVASDSQQPDGGDSSLQGQRTQARQESPAAAAAPPIGGVDGWTPPSGGGSCHTPSPVADEQQAEQQLPTPPAALWALSPGAYMDQPWLTELQQQLEAAGHMRCTYNDDTTDTDDDTTGTEADSSWVASVSGLDLPYNWQQQEQQQQQGPAAAAAAAAAGSLQQGLQHHPSLDTSHIEELLVQQLLVQQLLLDIESAPRRRHPHKHSSFTTVQQQQRQDRDHHQQQQRQDRDHHQQQQQQMGAEGQRQLPALLQQKLDQQQQVLKQQQLLQQQQLQLRLEIQQQQQRAAELDEMLHQELLQQLAVKGLNPQHAAAPQAQLAPVQLPSSMVSPAADMQGPSAAYAGMHLQPPHRMASWPLSGPTGIGAGILPPPAAAAAAAAAEGAAAAAGGSGGAAGSVGASGLALQGLSDAGLPALWRQGSRLSSDGGGSFVRKRDKMLMELPAVKDEGLAGFAAELELAVEQSGPSAEVPTKRMSITLPGCTEVASLPTSFSGRASGSGGAFMPRPQPADLHQVLQLSSCDDLGADMLWQQHQTQQQQQAQTNPYQQQQQQGVALGAAERGSSGVTGLASKIKTLLRGKKAKARRYNSVGAGASFTGSMAEARIPSADAVLALHDAAGLPGSAQFSPHQQHQQWAHPAGQQAQQQQQQPGHVAGWGSGHSSLVVSDGLPPAAAAGRQWHSLVGPSSVARDSCDLTKLPATVGGFSWHAEGSTMLATASMSAGAGAVRQAGAAQYTQHAPAFAAAPTGAVLQPPAGVAASDSAFAQQLAQLRASYAAQQGDVYELAMLQQQLPQQRYMPAQQGIAAAPGRAGPALPAEQVATSGAGGSSEKRGLMEKIVRVLKKGGQSAANLRALAAAQAGGMDTGGQDEEDGEELLIMGRTDAEQSLGEATLQWHWQAGGQLTSVDEVLHSLGAHANCGSAGGLGMEVDDGVGSLGAAGQDGGCRM